MAEISLARPIVSLVRQHQPHLDIVVRTKFASTISELYELGASQVICEEFEAATEIFAHVLAEYGLPHNAIEAYIEMIRREGLPKERSRRLETASFKNLQHLVSGAIVENFLLLEGSVATGKSLARLDFRKKTGATIIAVVRDNDSTLNPPASFVLTPGDLLVLMGSHQSLNMVKELLAPENVL